MLIVGDSLSMFCSICGMIRKNYSSIIMSGIEWNIVMYVFVNYVSGLMLDSCSSVSSVF